MSFAEVWERLRDPYWRLDHPEVTAALIGLVTGTLGLLFAWLQHKLIGGGS